MRKKGRRRSALSQQGLLDSVKPAYNQKSAGWPGTSSVFNRLWISMLAFLCTSPTITQKSLFFYHLPPLLDFMVHWKVTEAESPTVQLDATPSKLLVPHLYHPRIFMLVALAATLPIYSASRQAPNNAVLCTWLLGFVDYVQCIVYWWNDGFLYLLPVPFVLYWLMALSPGHACVISILLWCKYFHMHYNMVRHALHICFTSEISVSVSYFASQIQTLAYCSDDRQWLKLPLAHYMVIGDAAIICHSGFVIPFSIS